MSNKVTFAYYHGRAGLGVKITAMEQDCEVVFPSEHEGEPILEIGGVDSYSCRFCPTSVTIPASVKSIEKYAFDECKKLERVIFEEGSELGAICEAAFKDCENLREFTLPESVVLVSDYAFSECNSLCEIAFSEYFTAIGRGAFYKCPSLARVTFHPDCALTEIRDASFASCKALTEIIIPKAVEVIDGSFTSCSSLQKVTFAKGSRLKDVKHSAFLGTIVSEWDLTNCAELEFVGESSFSSYEAPAIKVIFPEGCKAEIHECAFVRDITEYVNKPEGFVPVGTPEWNKKQKKGCYVATCVYGSYDCPEVWTLRRYRDETLSASRLGRAFIKVYYAVSPTLVRWFGKTSLFQKICRGRLDKMVARLREKGVEDTPYED